VLKITCGAFHPWYHAAAPLNLRWGAIFWKVSVASALPIDLGQHGSRGGAAVGYERKVVVFADMVGYSALTSRDEVGTHRMWMAFRHEVLEPACASFEATIIRILGDGALLTFDHSENALDWCLTVQRQIRSARVGKSTRYAGLSMRCAAHIAQVIPTEGDIYGDGVNLTKRLQESIAADGIIVTEELIKSLPAARDVPNRRLGQITMRNISNSVSAYEVLQDFNSDFVGLRTRVAELPSIAVMPLRLLGNDREMEYFAAGVVEDIITSLCAFRELIVISRASTMALDQSITDPREIGRLLDVRYVMTGTLRLGGERIRINAEMADSRNGDIVFSEKSDLYHSELFETQDRITEYIVSRIAPNVRAAERAKAIRKPPDNFTAYDLVLKGLDLMTNLDKESYDEALVLFEQARELDPDFSMPVAQAGRLKTRYVGQGWAEDHEAAVEDATATARKAVSMDRQSAFALASLGHAMSYLNKDYETALILLDRARELGPSLSIAWALSSATLTYVGRAAEAVEHAMHAIRLSPNDPEIYQYYHFAGLAHYINREFEEALSFAEKAHAENPNYTSNWRFAILVNAASGNIDQAQRFSKKLLAAEPDFRIETYIEKNCPFQREEDRAMVADHLSIAGMT